MRESDGFIEQMFTVKGLEDFVPADHPLRPIWLMVNDALLRLDRLFTEVYGRKAGRPMYCAG